MKRRVREAGLLVWVLSSGCADEEDLARPTQVTAEVSETIRTVVVVEWRTEEPTIGLVEFGEGDALDRRTLPSVEPTQEHRATLLGLVSDTEYTFRVVTWEDEREGPSSELATVRTGSLPTGMPALQAEGSGHDLFTVVPVLGRTTAVTILDGAGNIVWYHTEDRELDVYRARLSVDGESLLYNAASVSGDPADGSELVRVPLDGGPPTSISIPLLAHDFVEHPDGTLAAIVVEYRDFDGASLRGDKIVEVAPDGEQSTVWSAWDCFDPALHPSDNMEHGWTFANALDYDPEQEVYYLGMRNFSSITRIDRRTGQCDWVLGSTARTLDFAEGADRFLHQHQFQVIGDRIVVFDNEGSPRTESRVLEYALDLEAGVATQVWSYVSDPPVSSFVLGEPIRLPGGDTFIDWSASGSLERVTQDGTSRWKLNARSGFVFGFATLAETL